MPTSPPSTDSVPFPGRTLNSSAPVRVLDRRHLIRSAVAGGAARLVTVGTSFVSVAITTRALGVEGYALYAVVTALGALLPFLDIGVGLGLVTELTRRSGEPDIADEDVQAMLDRGATFTIDAGELAACDTYVICVPTPLKNKFPDLTAVEAATKSVGAALSPGDLVILESTTYPGTTEHVVGRLLNDISGLKPGPDFHLAFSPERIDPGNSRYGIRNTPKVVGGLTPEATAAAEGFYLAFVEHVHTVQDPAEAELAKLLENTFRHVNIALVNEMAIFCRELGVDLNKAIDAAATKPFGFMPFRPGPGVGGHCIPIDPSYLSWRVRQLGYTFRFVELAEEINERMPAYVVNRAAEVLNDVEKPLRGSKILMLGVAYKKNIGDLRESPAFAIARRLGARGAEVSWHDPFVDEFIVDGLPLKRSTQVDLAVREADLTLVVTDHDGIDWTEVAHRASLILDTRNVYRTAREGVFAL